MSSWFQVLIPSLNSSTIYDNCKFSFVVIIALFVIIGTRQSLRVLSIVCIMMVICSIYYILARLAS